MEFIAGTAVIIILLYILGFGFNLIASGIGVCLVAVTVLCLLFFVVFFVRLLLSKKVTGTFIRIDRLEKGHFDTAFYDVDGTEKACMFPCEMAMRDKFYKKDKPVKLLLDVRGKRVYDKNATLTILFGTLLFGSASVFFMWGISELFRQFN